MPTANWYDERKSVESSMAVGGKSLATIGRGVEQKAMGLILPRRVWNVSSVAAAKRCWTGSGWPPVAMRLTSLLRNESTVAPASVLMRGLTSRWIHREGVRSGPIAVSREVHRAAKATTASEMRSRGGGLGWRQREG